MTDHVTKKERTTKHWGTYPRCQHVESGKQCGTTVYANDLCWKHYTVPKAKQPKAMSDQLVAILAAP